MSLRFSVRRFFVNIFISLLFISENEGVKSKIFVFTVKTKIENGIRPSFPESAFTMKKSIIDHNLVFYSMMYKPGDEENNYKYFEEENFVVDVIDTSNCAVIPKLKYFNKLRKTVVLTFCFCEKLYTLVRWPLLDEYVKRGDYNVLLVYYGNRSLAILQFIMGDIRQEIITCMNQITDTQVLTSDDFHFIGFSLGAPFLASVSRKMKAGPVPRLTGLDPMDKASGKVIVHQAIKKGDAKYIDLMFTSDMGVWSANERHYGDLRVWMNYGMPDDPYCVARKKKKQVEQKQYLKEPKDPMKGLCNHFAATKYWNVIISSNENKFIGKLCGSFQEFYYNQCGSDNEKIYVYDLDTPSSVKGDLFIYTNGEKPYTRGQAGTKVPDNAQLDVNRFKKKQHLMWELRANL